MAYSLARFERDNGHQVRLGNQDMAIEIAPSVFVQSHTCSYCDQLELDFASPKSRKWLHEKSSIHFGQSMVECKVAAEGGCTLLAWIFDNLDLNVRMFPKADWPLVAYVGDNRDKVRFGFANMIAAMRCEREYREGSCWSSKTLTIFRSNNTTMPLSSIAPTGEFHSYSSNVYPVPSNLFAQRSRPPQCCFLRSSIRVRQVKEASLLPVPALLDA